MRHRHPQLLQNVELLSNCAMSDVETCLWLVRQEADPMLGPSDHGGDRCCDGGDPVEVLAEEEGQMSLYAR
jgi:hypothetical protein